MLEPWLLAELAKTILVWVAYGLTYMVVFPKIKIWKPHWEMRAEFASMVPGIMMLLLLCLLVTI